MPLPAAIALFAATAALASVAASAFALGPHETALVVNSESTASVLLGETWARLRGVPDACVVRVALPRGADGAFPAAVTHAEFLERIWTPATNALAASGAAPQILAWAYSCDFPLRISTNAVSPSPAPVPSDFSLAGATFLRGRMPDRAEIAGAFESPLFAGPSPDDASGGRSAQSLDRLRNKLLDGTPLPSAALAWTGPRGLSLQEARAALSRSAGADFSSPAGAVLFAGNGDVRWKTRAWSVAPAAAALALRSGTAAAAGAAAASGVEAVVSTNPVSSFQGPLAGLFSGGRSVPAPPDGFVPGAFADHMTSYAAAFDAPSQMKATEWLRRGAAFTAGTVTEPYALWRKFPTAQVFAHQLDGCTALEALFLSVANPLQLQPLGDPLSAPWAPRLEPEIVEDVPSASGRRFFRAALAGGAPLPRSWRCTWLLDGVQAGAAAVFALPADSRASTLRLVVRDDFRVRHQGRAEISL